MPTGLQTTGMLVVESVVPGSPADGVLEPGDVLVRLNGKVRLAALSIRPFECRRSLCILSRPGVQGRSPVGKREFALAM